MLSIGGTTRVFLAVQPVDLRASFNRLHGLVLEVLRQDPASGHWFLFTNRRGTRIKIYVFDGTGTWILTKRLAAGRFTWPRGDDVALSLRTEELAALVNGLEVVAKKEWYRK